MPNVKLGQDIRNYIIFTFHDHRSNHSHVIMCKDRHSSVLYNSDEDRTISIW